MIYSYYIWVTIFVIISYVIIVDPNGLRLIDLMGKLIKINFQRTYWMVRYHPANPITNLLFKWKYARLAKQLEKDLDKTAGRG